MQAFDYSHYIIATLLTLSVFYFVLRAQNRAKENKRNEKMIDNIGFKNLRK